MVWEWLKEWAQVISLFLLAGIGVWAVIYPIRVRRRQRLSDRLIQELDRIIAWAEEIDKKSQELSLTSDKYNDVGSKMYTMMLIAANHGQTINEGVFNLAHMLTRFTEIEVENGDAQDKESKLRDIETSLSTSANKLIKQAITTKNTYKD